MNALFITYNTANTASCRFRSYQPAKALQKIGVNAKVQLIYQLTKKDIDSSDIVIFQRIPQAIWYFQKLHLPTLWIRNKIETLFQYSIQKKMTGIDLDDYIFMEGSGIQTGVPDRVFSNLLKTAHFITASTPILASHLKYHNPKTYVVRNALDFTQYESTQLSLYLSMVVNQIKKWKKEGFAILGWVCGHHHQGDFPLFYEILEALDPSQRARMRIILVGFNIGTQAKYKNMILKTQLIHWRELHHLIQQFDINLIPLQDTILNQCKSELKLIEAGFWSVPSVVSNVGEYQNLLLGETCGALSHTAKNFADKIVRLMSHQELRTSVGKNARNLTLRHYNLETRAKEYHDLFKTLFS